MNLHRDIMNIQSQHAKRSFSIAYNTGHRDARHSAAELSLKYCQYIEELESLARACVPESTIEELRKECGI